MHEIISIFKSITISTLIIILSFFLIFRLENIPRSFPVLLFIVSLFGVTGPRIFYRFFKDKKAVNHFPSEGEGTLSGLIVKAEAGSGLAKKVTRLVIGGALEK